MYGSLLIARKASRIPVTKLSIQNYFLSPRKITRATISQMTTFFFLLNAIFLPSKAILLIPPVLFYEPFLLFPQSIKGLLSHKTNVTFPPSISLLPSYLLGEWEPLQNSFCGTWMMETLLWWGAQLVLSCRMVILPRSQVGSSRSQAGVGSAIVLLGVF